jgi:hypothetical protein
MAIIRPTLTNGYEVCPLTSKKEQKLMSFENKILRIVCGLVYDNELECWRGKRNKEIRKLTRVPRITNFVKAQRIKWFGHVMRRSDLEYLKVMVE